MEVNRMQIGVAGELRVMSELLLRGFNPAKSYLDNGVDLILENGCKIQIKTSRKNLYVKCKREQPTYKYQFVFQNWKNKKHKLNVDFVICWAIEDNIFFIIPKSEILNISGLIFVPSYKKNKLEKYINNWKILKGG